MKSASTSEGLSKTEFKVGWGNTQSLDKMDCPVCRDKSAKPKVLDVTSHLKPHPTLDLFKCLACGSHFYYPVREAEYSNQSGSGFSARFAIELGAGIDSMIRTLHYLSVSEKKPSLLEIGCGVGFLANFAEKILKWNVIGIDPSPSATEGRKLFGDFILTADTDNLDALESRKFDIVYASEVVEHVENPLAFINSLRERMSRDGVLILTTPDADSIDKSSPFISLLAALSPGFHVILFSEKSLEMLLRQAGFSHIKLVKEPRRLFAYASDAEISVDEKRDFQKPYLEYLTSLAINDKSKSLNLGALYRSFKEHVNSGDSEESSIALRSCEKILIEHFKTDLNRIDSIITHAEGCNSLDEFGAVLPFCICGILYCKGMHLIRINKPAEALDVFRGTFKVASIMLKLEPAFLEEPADILWNAKFHEGFAHLLSENRSDARDCFNTVLDAKTDDIRPSDALLAKCWDQIGISYFQEGLHENALMNFEKVLSEFASTAEKDILDESRTHADLSKAFLSEENNQQETVCKTDTKSDSTVAAVGLPTVTTESAKIRYAIDLTWSDDHGIAVQGWMFSEDGKLDNPTITIDGHTAPIEFWHSRPDVAPFFPHLTVAEDCGFWVYISRKAKHEITISTGQGSSFSTEKTVF
ncbi:MAG: class I SAM-dependent methyltransferase, partial [Leptolyngbya sp.]|nr:class I SAM-dependent methyltransferase [Candidatus Melainabacteria bacterium]